MSIRYKGGIISATPPTTSQSSASGSWTLSQQMQATGGGNWPVNGPFYIEDVFSTWLYTGTGAALTITNGINLSSNGGLVWIKNRTAAYDHILGDTARGASVFLRSNTTDPQSSTANHFSSFNSNGFSIGSNANVNLSSNNYASWTFREQPKFFDVVTYTGTGSNTTIAHNLGSVPGSIIVKRTDTTAAWAVYHRSLANTQYLVLNTTAAAATGATWWNSTTPTSSVFSVGTDASVNASGGTYVAYIFAHDAGGFGLTGTDNVISCGSVTDNNRVELGYEPQFLLMKKTSATGNWILVDTMRGLTVDTSVGNATLLANTTAAEASGSLYANIDATGFKSNLGSPGTYIYIAIRRGPMKVPTTGTSVFNVATWTATTKPAFTSGFPLDLAWYRPNISGVNSVSFSTRLTGATKLLTSSTAAEAAESTAVFDSMTGWFDAGGLGPFSNYYSWMFRRAPGFFDVVCYTGTGANADISHNLGVVPELMIVKGRSALSVNSNWCVYCSHVIGAANTGYLYLNSTDSYTDNTTFWSTSPTSSVFSLSSNNTVNENTDTFVAYLFATCPGVSKVGSYTGTGTTLQINCGFTGGARFVLIKRTDSTGDWYVWDSARGIVAGNDPYLLLNSTAAEVTSTDYIDTASAGFEISSTAPAAINANGGTFIFLAIA